MKARVLADGEYEKLFEKATGRSLGEVWTSMHADAVAQMKQVHRLLAEGRHVEDLTPSEQVLARAFDGIRVGQIGNNYGWEPCIEDVDAEPADESPAPKPKKSGK